MKAISFGAFRTTWSPRPSLTLDVPQTVDTGDTISNGYTGQVHLSVNPPHIGRKNSLKTRPVSSSSPPVEAPEILPSRIEETSEAAIRVDQIDGAH
jgi:hypothetical protein